MNEDDKDLEILSLKKIIAEQSMAQLMRDELVKDYARIKANYDKLITEIEAKEKPNMNRRIKSKGKI